MDEINIFENVISAIGRDYRKTISKNKGRACMLNEKTEVALENRFRKIIQRNKNIHNAYLLIHSEKQGIHLNIAEGKTGSTTAHPKQPYFIASVDIVVG